ncbi:MAG: modification methylase [Anaerolineaceae bacterium 4572_78]|nr:MAG: modification methylase [Anaerolineaceae bacterium 4572_78]
MPKIKSPLRYPGGKSRAVKYLYQFIPNYQEFREPFFGGGSMTFFCQQKKSHAHYIANDLNYELYCFWTMVKSDVGQLVNEILHIKKTWTNGRQLFQTILARRHDDLSILQRAVDFFVLNRITFSGVVDSGGYSEQSFQKRFTLSSIERLKMAHKIVKNMLFTSNDYKELLICNGQDIFIFLDPPYYSATKSRLYGKKGNLHVGFNHKRLHKYLKSCSHHWLMTYDNSLYIQDLYSDFYQLSWELQYGMNNYKKTFAAKGKELLISNYPLAHNKNKQFMLFKKA